MAFYYLADINKDEIGQGAFGYSKQFNGIMVSLNSIFTEGSGEEAVNLLQLFKNDGNDMVNAMKIRNEKNCKVKFRNMPAESFFHFRVEYKEPNIQIFWYD